MELLNAFKKKIGFQHVFRLKVLSGSVSKKTISNIVSLFFIRGGNIFLQLLLVPISIRFISVPSYGLWLTISSIIGWLSIMDIGLANGLRNMLTIAIVDNNMSLAKKYVSTSYAFLIIIAIIGFIGCYFLIDGLNWQKLLNIPSDMTLADFKKILLIVISSFFLTFILKPIASVAYATHKAYIEFLILFAANFFNLVIIWVLLQLLPQGNILLLAYCFCFSPILVTLILTIFLFKSKFSDFCPSSKFVDFSCAGKLMSLSGKFFVIQIAALVIMNSNILLIAHYFGNADVTEYNIAQRYFNIPFTIIGIVLVPFWNVFTEAYARKNAELLKKIMNKLLRLASILALISVIMIVVSDFIYNIWLGNLLHISFGLNISTCFYTIALIFGSVYATCVNGTGKIKLHMLTSIFSSVLHIPIAIIFIKYFHMGVSGLLLISSFWIIVSICFRHVQYLRLIKFQENESFWYR